MQPSSDPEVGHLDRAMVNGSPVSCTRPSKPPSSPSRRTGWRTW